jgi:hypothetical protein
VHLKIDTDNFHAQFFEHAFQSVFHPHPQGVGRGCKAAEAATTTLC